MKTIFLSAALFICSLLHSQTALQKNPLEPFNQLEINGDITVYLNQTNEETISASSDDFAGIKYDLTNGLLKINGEAGKVYLHLKNIEKLVLNGSSEVYSSDTLKVDPEDGKFYEDRGRQFKTSCRISRWHIWFPSKP